MRLNIVLPRARTITLKNGVKLELRGGRINKPDATGFACAAFDGNKRVSAEYFISDDTKVDTMIVRNMNGDIGDMSDMDRKLMDQLEYDLTHNPKLHYRP